MCVCVQGLLQEETRQKLALNTRLRQLEDEQNRLKELLEEEEEGKKSVEKQLHSSQAQVTNASALPPFTRPFKSRPAPLSHALFYHPVVSRDQEENGAGSSEPGDFGGREEKAAERGGEPEPESGGEMLRLRQAGEDQGASAAGA